jgi:hypothetical protein
VGAEIPGRNNGPSAARSDRQLGNKPDALAFHRTYLRNAPTAGDVEKRNHRARGRVARDAPWNTARHFDPCGGLHLDVPTWAG